MQAGALNEVKGPGVYRYPLLVMLALLAMVHLACDEGRSPTAPDPDLLAVQLTVTEESEHFIFHHTPQDQVLPANQEEYYRWAVARLGVAAPGKIHYYKYLSTAHMLNLIGRSTRGWADVENFSVHTVNPWDNHETVHLLSSLVGRPVDFFNEGLAVALSVDPTRANPTPYWNSLPVHTAARHAGSELLPLADLLESRDFRSYSDLVTYPQAGSFVYFLIEEHGMGPVLTLFAGGSRDDSRSAVRAGFQAAYGEPIEEAERRWRGYLGV